MILILFSFVQYFLLKRNFRGNRPDFSLPSTHNTGQDLIVKLELKLFFIMPGFRIFWETELFWPEGGRYIFNSFKLKKGNNVYEIPLGELKRGSYGGPSGILVVEDLFGFTRFKVYEGERVSLKIHPQIIKDGFKDIKVIRGGSEATNHKKRLRSEDLLEVRKYYPGDDARRINWKMFAASGELFMRIGEEVPPPKGEIILALLSQSPLVGQSYRASELTDSLIDDFLSFLCASVKLGCQVILYIPGDKEPFVYDPLKPDHLLNRLASVTTRSVLHLEHLLEPLYLMSHSGSDFTSILSQTKEVEIKVFIKSFALNEVSRSFKDLLLRDEKNGKYKKSHKHLLESINLQGQEDLVQLKKTGKQKVHCEII